MSINKKGGVTTALVPKGHHFDLELQPTLVEGT